MALIWFSKSVVKAKMFPPFLAQNEEGDKMKPLCVEIIRQETCKEKHLLLTPLRHFGYDYDAFIHVSSNELISAYKYSAWR